MADKCCLIDGVDREFLDGIKTGDPIAVLGFASGDHLLTVTSATKGAIGVGKYVFSRENGSLNGCTMRCVRLAPVTPERFERITRETYQRTIDEKLKCAATDQLRRIVAILDEPKAGEHHGERAGEGDGRKDGKA